jgi:hypothetical protein
MASTILSNGFQGLPREPVALAQWHVRNFIGFPGIALPFKIATEILVLSIYVVGAVLAWRSGRRAFATVIIGILIFYPLTLGGLAIVTPIISNRIFIPCIIPASMLFGAAVGLPERRTLQFVVASSVLFLACWSEFEAYRLRGKIEDMPQALAVAAARGFEDAPILSCPMTAGTAHFYAPDRPVFFADGRGALIRFDNRMFSLPKRERQLTDGTLMRGFLVSNGLIVDARIALRAVERVVLFPTSCDTDRGRR